GSAMRTIFRPRPLPKMVRMADPTVVPSPTSPRRSAPMRNLAISRPATRYLLLACLALLIPSARAAEPTVETPDGYGMSGERLRRVDDVIRRYVEAKKVSGAVTLV